MEREEILSLYYGGALDWQAVPPIIPVEKARNLELYCLAAANAFISLLGLESLEICFTRSTGMTAALHRIGDRSYLIALPIGLYARVHCFAARLWGYKQRDKSINPKALLILGNSPADFYDPEKFVIPPPARAILDQFEDEKEFWSELARFDEKNPHDEATLFNVEILANNILILVVFHELAHVAFGHMRFLEFAKASVAGEPPERGERLIRLIRRGVELEADSFAGAQLASALAKDAAFRGNLSGADRGADFFRVGFALVILLGAYDPRLRSLGAYDRRSYPHPIVRHHAIRYSIGDCFRSNEALLNLWGIASTMGWIEAEQSLNWFTVMECFVDAQPDTMIPIHALVYGGEASLPYVSSELQFGQAIFEATAEARRRFFLGTLTAANLVESFAPFLDRPESGFADGLDYRPLDPE